MKELNFKYFKFCYYSNCLIDKIKQLNEISISNQKVDIAQIEKAIFYAKKYHGNQRIQTGEPYYAHPLEVAYMVAFYTATVEPQFYQTHMLVTAILHDTIEDTDITEKIIAKAFDGQIAAGVESLSRNKEYGKIKFRKNFKYISCKPKT